jgi:gliding motility-associated-like protein
MKIRTYIKSLSKLMLCTAFLPALSFAGDHDHTPAATKQVSAQAGISFVENRNQWNTEVRYKTDLPGGELFLTDKGFVYSYYSLEDLHRIHELGHERPDYDRGNELVNCHAYRVIFEGAQAAPKVRGTDRKPQYHNYFLGNDPSKWAGNVPVFGSVLYEGVYQGVDAVVYSNDQNLKYDFVVKAGADPAQIKLKFEGVQPRLLSNGNLLIETSVNRIEEEAPLVYQIVDGQQVAVKCNYTWKAGQRIGFDFPEGYNKSLDLVIDPNLVFGTYSGGSGSTYGFSATYDSDGNLYAGGQCFNAGWPTSVGAFQVTFAGGQDAGINKYNALGTALIYSTYFGGSGNDLPNNMVVNELDELIVCGSTTSSNMPTTTGCYSSSNSGGADLYIAHFNVSGAGLIGATYLGGSGNDGVNLSSLSPNYGDPNRGEVFADAAGNIYIAGSTSSADFPVTANAVQGSSGGGQDGCVAKFNSTLSTLLYSTYLGGSGNDACYALVLNTAGNVITVGGTNSADFPTTPGAMHTSQQGGTDGFASLISTSAGLLASSYLGTASYDHAYKVQIDPQDNIYVMGQTDGSYPISAGVYHETNGDIFIDKLSPSLNTSLLSTRMGRTQGVTRFVPTAFMYDDCGNVYLCGFYPSTTMPVSPNAFNTTGGFWLGVLEPDFVGLLYGTYVHGGNHVDGGTSRFDPRGVVYHSVCTADLNFPTDPGSWSPNKLAGGYDCASFKFNFEAMGVRAEFDLAVNSVDSGCAPHTVSFLNESIVADNYTWDFGDGSATTTVESPTHTFTEPGIYTVTLHANNPQSCVTDDTFTKKIYVFSALEPQLATNDTIICLFQSVDLTVDVTNTLPGALSYSWSPANAVIGNPNQQSVTVNSFLSQDFTVTVTHTDAMCSSSADADIHIAVFDPILFDLANNDTVICKGETMQLVATGDTIFTYQWTPDLEMGTPNAMVTSLTPTESREYMLTVTYSNCLPHQSTVRVDVEPVPEVNLGPDRTICSYDTIQMFAAVLPSTFNNYTFTWEPAASLTDATVQAPVFSADQTSNVYVTVKTPAGCTGRDTMTVTVYPGDFMEVPVDTGICPPAEVQLLAKGAAQYKWTPSYGLSADDVADPIASPETSTTYTLIGTSEHQCYDTHLVRVNVYPQAVLELPEEVSIWPGESYQIDPGGNCLYFDWYPSSGLNNAKISNPLASPEVRTRYFVTATTENGCALRDSIDILVHLESALDMPNAFAPGSGTNNTFKVSKRGIAQLRYFRVYNRWGNLVFETNDINQGWDGRYKEKEQPTGVYVYSIEAITNTGNIFSKNGNVTLIR